MLMKIHIRKCPGDINISILSREHQKNRNLVIGDSSLSSWRKERMPCTMVRLKSRAPIKPVIRNPRTLFIVMRMNRWYALG